MKNTHVVSGPSARQRLRAVHDQQAACLARFAAVDEKAAKLRRALAAVEEEQLGALGELAGVAGVELAADLTGVPVGKVREALGRCRRHDDGNIAAEAGEVNGWRPPAR